MEGDCVTLFGYCLRLSFQRGINRVGSLVSYGARFIHAAPNYFYLNWCCRKFILGRARIPRCDPYNDNQNWTTTDKHQAIKCTMEQAPENYTVQGKEIASLVSRNWAKSTTTLAIFPLYPCRRSSPITNNQGLKTFLSDILQCSGQR